MSDNSETIDVQAGLARKAWRSEDIMIAAVSTVALMGVVLLAGAIVFGFVVGPKWWHWGSFIVLTIVLFIPLAMAFFIPLPIVVVLNVAISHSVWLKKHGAAPMKGVDALN